MVTTMPEAVRASMRIIARHRALFQRGRHSMSEADIGKVIETFNDVGAKWVLVGAHTIGLLTEPRATEDFDFIVEGKKLKAVLKELRARFGDLDEQDIDAAIRLRAIDVDLIRSTSHPLFKRALELTRRMDTWNVPRPEVVIAMKFHAAVSRTRSFAKRVLDVADLQRVFLALGRKQLDIPLTLELAKLVYPGGDRELSEWLEKTERQEGIAL